MAAQWYYQISGRELGPVSTSDLKQLAATGQLLPDDLLRRSDMTEWVEARKAAELFPDVEKATTQSAPPKISTDEATVAPPVIDVGTQASTWASELASTAKGAGRLAAKQAERAKLTKVTLPSAYRELGRRVYAEGDLRPARPDLHQRIEEIEKALEENSVTAGKPTTQSMGAKAQGMFDSAKAAGNRKLLEHKLSAAFAELGKAAFEDGGKYAATEMSPIPELRSRIAALDKDLDEMSQSSSADMKNTATNPIAIGLLVIFCFPVGLYLVWRHPTWSRNIKLAWTGGFFMLLLVGALLPDSTEMPGSKATAPDTHVRAEGDGQGSADIPAGRGLSADNIVRQIRIGTPKQAVLARLGTPDVSTAIGQGEAWLFYTSDTEAVFMTIDKRGNVFSVVKQQRDG